MSGDKLHAFPEDVKLFEKEGQVFTIMGLKQTELILIQMFTSEKFKQQIHVIKVLYF